MSAPLLDVDGLTVAFGRALAVEGMSFSVAPGEAVALVGESGSGKSVTALSIMGLLPEGAGRVAGGTIAFEGRDLATITDAERRRVRGERIGMIFQEPMTSLNPMLTIGRQMTEGLEVHRGAAPREARARAEAMLERVGIDRPADRLRQYPHEFSGGMRQRVMIAMTMALEPRLLIADEPTTALDVTVQAQILDLMRDLARDTGTSLLLITHDMGVVAEIADRVVVMREGRRVEEGAVGPIFAAPRAAYTRELLASVPRIDGSGRTPARRPEAEPVLRYAGVSRSFGGRGLLARGGVTHAVREVDLTLRPGETLALVGESGSGKSTLGRIGVGLERADRGSVVVGGQDIARARGRRLRALRSVIQMVFQDPFASLDPRFTVARTLMEPVMIHARVGRREARARASSLLERVGLDASALDRLPHEFSGGQRQRVAVARALGAEPSVIVADEPTSALDVSVQARVLDLLVELQEERGLAYLFITHDLAVVRRIAHRVAVMRRGEIVEEGTVDDVLKRPSHPYTRALLDAAPVPDPSRRAPRARREGEPPAPQTEDRPAASATRPAAGALGTGLDPTAASPRVGTSGDGLARGTAS